MTGEQYSARDITGYLRGVAILGVMVSHYRHHFAGADASLEGYGNALVMLFFVLSGYGNALSLAGRRGGERLNGFYRDRFLRLYPLYWVLLAFLTAASGQRFGLAAWLGLNSPIWFVHAIVQCMALCPLFFTLIERFGAQRAFFGASILLAAANAWLWLGDPPWRDALSSNLVSLRGVVLGHLFAFFLGMLLPETERFVRSRAATGGLAGLSRVPGAVWLILLVAAALANGVAWGGWPDLLSGLGYTAAVFALCLALLAFRGSLPAMAAVRPIGEISYAVCLFEPIMYFALLAAGFYPGGRGGLLALTACLPLFFLVCAASERGVRRLIAATRGQVKPRREGGG